MGNTTYTLKTTHFQSVTLITKTVQQPLPAGDAHKDGLTLQFENRPQGRPVFAKMQHYLIENEPIHTL